MTTFDDAGNRHLTPVDKHAAERAARLRQLGLGEKAEPEFDAFAQRVAQALGVPNAMVNFISDSRQYLSGLYSSVGADAAPDTDPRTAPMETGYCPHVIARGMALVLEDVCDYPRFAGNDVVDRMNVRSYLGAPLIDRTGIALGTVCVIDSEPRPWGREGLNVIKTLAAEGVELIHRREREILG
ncbi:GAF domain-containing protein [Saccharopolyspora hordei]|uniref:GAF domain-containing protein n=1 Tax=Saccharopolyspora hordei TaxID=1838 RepID=A0A853AN50_9PSEU|nr:GAF domain-containing protein [Saccharopolyspora hordei]NYI85595.1 GAF domain-containing protein [Saccharopolyspora hordei]